MSEETHEFGSVDTQTKLNCLQEYLQAYAIALRNKGFERLYIDAFAGTGIRTVTHAALPIFEGGQTIGIEVNTPGSAKIAMKIEPQFTRIILVEQDERRSAALKKMALESGDSRIQVKEGDANAIVADICKSYSWKRAKMRGVVFLDPYGMEVSWSTVEAIAQTEALDCWYFFPLSGLYRNAPRDANRLDDVKVANLNRVLGTEKWREEWYFAGNNQSDLFGYREGDQREIDVNGIEVWVRNRLSEIFKGSVLSPLRLYHTNGAPMASLFFAMSNPNPKAKELGSRIASHILKVGRLSQVRSR